MATFSKLLVVFRIGRNKHSTPVVLLTFCIDTNFDCWMVIMTFC
jgi:hypothetical protein